MRIFRRIRGKRDDKEGRNSGPTTALQDRNFPSSSAQNRNVGRLSAPPETSGTGRLRIRSTYSSSLEGLRVVMASPASSMPAEEARNLIQIEQQGFCPVCCNLDPYQAPPDTDRYSYPRTEYNIPAGTPVGKITIENSEHLLESLRRGCLYCGMVRTSLSGVHPGWEAEKSFIHLYLAPGLPVIVHLQFGATGSVAMGREEAMRELGVDLPEGQRMNLTYTLSEASKPPIDIEIYRPVLGLDETTVGGMWSNEPRRLESRLPLTIMTRCCLGRTCATHGRRGRDTKTRQRPQMLRLHQ